MRRIIRIFLASSIVEFANERMAIENFIRNISDKFEENYDVKIQPLLCENFDDAYSKIRKQEEYNEKIRNSDLCFFIFFTKAGEYTREEFEVARKKFEETGKPKIYTYFKVIKDETAEQSLYDFMNELDKTFGHYYGTFEHIDTVKLRILLNLKLQEMDFLEIKVDGDACVVDGKKTLSLENVSEFANNSIFQELKSELYEVEVRYFNLKAKYEKDKCSQSEEREYIEIASKRQNLIDAIEEVQKNIFTMSLRMCQDEARGEITLRQKEAYRLFEAGDLEGANNILDFAEIKNDYQRRKAIREAEQKKDAQIFIREGRTKIGILNVMSSLSTRFEEIEWIYDEITQVAFEEQVALEIINDFAWFLYKQNKHQKAYETAKSLERFISDSTDDEKTSSMYHLLGTICGDLSKKKGEAEYYYKRAIEICEELIKTNPQRFNPNLAISYNNVGAFYNDQGQPQKTEEYYKKALTIFEKLVVTNPEMFYPDLAMSYNNAGNFYDEQGQPKKAEQFYEKAVKIYEKLTESNSELFNPDLATSYNNIGAFYNDQGQSQKAEKCYKKSIAIREKLADINPARFNPDLAGSYNNMGIFYDKQKQPEEAEKYYKKSIAIREKLVETNSEKFNPELAMSYNNVGNFFNNQGQPEQAEKYLKKAIKIYEKLVETNSERFNSELAMSYNNAVIFFNNQGYPEQAEDYLKKGVDIYEKLVETNSKRFCPELADSYNNAGNFYDEQGQSKKAEQFYEKAVKIYEKLAEINPERFYPDLVMIYNNVGVFYNDQGQLKKTEQYYKKLIQICEKLVVTNPERFNCEIADAYHNIGFFYYDQGQLEKTTEFFEKALKIYEKLAETSPERFRVDLAISYFNYADLSKDNACFQKALALAKTMPEDSYCKQIIDALEGK